VPNPQSVQVDDVLSILPYGSATIEVAEGGLEMLTDDGQDVTLIAHAAAVVMLDLDDATMASLQGATS